MVEEQEQEEQEQEEDENGEMEADDDEKMGKRQRRMDKERKPPTLAGRLRKTPCQHCVRGGRQCLAQVGGWACVSCAKLKMRCVDAQEGDADRV